MTEEFENLKSVDEMIDFLAGDEEEGDEEIEEVGFDEPGTTKNILIDLQILNVQAFLKMLPRYLNLSDENRKHFDEAMQMFADPRIDVLTRHSALALMSELLFPEEPTETPKQIVRKNKVHDVPCEDCENKPTHMVEFKQGDRVEQHYLCEDCEKRARTE